MSYNQSKKLTRSVRNRRIAGVCDGLARYFDVDPLVVRLIFLLLLLVVGGGALAYLICWIVMPEEA